MREPPPVATHRSAVAHAATTGAHKSARASMSMRSGAEEAHEGAHERDANRPADQRTCRSAALRSAPWGAARRALRLLPHGAASATPAPLLRQSSTARPRRVPRAAAPVALHDVRRAPLSPPIRRQARRPPPTARRGVHRGPPRPPPATEPITRHGVRRAPVARRRGYVAHRCVPNPHGRGLPASGLPLPGPTREPGRDGRYSAKFSWRSRWSCERPVCAQLPPLAPLDTTVREAASASRTVPPPAGNEAAASPSPLDPVQRADPRRTHRNAPVATETERTHGRTATHTGSTRHAPHTRSYKNLAIRDTTS